MTQQNMSESLVIIPTYNEKENIEQMLRCVFAMYENLDILVVEDSSPDGTADIVKSLQIEFKNRLHIIERKGKLGLGTAYIAGFHWALDRQYEYIFEMDADFSHPVEKIGELLHALKQGAGVAIGSRYVQGGSVKNWDLQRIILSYGASLYVRLILWLPVKDTTAGFIGYKRAVLEKIQLTAIVFKGYGFQIAMKYAAYKLGFKLQEVPISFKDRELGVSKMSLSIFKEAVLGVWQMRFRKIGFKKAVLALFLLAMACQNNDKPKNLIAEDAFIQMYLDSKIVEQVIKDKLEKQADSLKNAVREQAYETFFKEHNINELDFTNSYNYYNKDIESTIAFTNKVKDSLNERLDKIKHRKQEHQEEVLVPTP